MKPRIFVLAIILALVGPAQLLHAHPPPASGARSPRAVIGNGVTTGTADVRAWQIPAFADAA